MMQLTNLGANNATGGDLEPGPRLRRVGAQVVRERAGAQWVAPRWLGKRQALNGWRPAFLPRASHDLFGINDDNDDANVRSNLAMQLELRNQSKYTMLE